MVVFANILTIVLGLYLVVGLLFPVAIEKMFRHSVREAHVVIVVLAQTLQLARCTRSRVAGWHSPRLQRGRGEVTISGGEVRTEGPAFDGETDIVDAQHAPGPSRAAGRRKDVFAA